MLEVMSSLQLLLAHIQFCINKHLSVLVTGIELRQLHLTPVHGQAARVQPCGGPLPKPGRLHARLRPGGSRRRWRLGHQQQLRRQVRIELEMTTYRTVISPLIVRLARLVNGQVTA